jgi:ornithine carbamoyltransferase
MQHFIDLLDCDAARIEKLLKEAAKLKKAHNKGKHKPLLQGRVLGLIFEKPSLRTRVSFKAAMDQLGGSTIFLGPSEIGLGQRECIADVARTLSQYVDALVLRTFKHDTVLQFARWSGVPVINGLSDCHHPCQALGDLLTMRELWGDFAGHTVAFIGDGNNVARSLAIGCGKLGVRFILSAPSGYGFDAPFLETYHSEIKGDLRDEPDPRRAVAEADLIYTDVWTSMGQEDEAEERKRHFLPYQVNAELLALAPADAKVMHCLPAHRNEEVTEEVLDGPRSVVFEQAGNRMHAQKALLLWMMDQD